MSIHQPLQRSGAAARVPVLPGAPNVIQLDLLAEPGGRIKTARTSNRKKKSKKKAHQKKAGGLQYKMKLPKRLTPRKIAYRNHVIERELDNDAEWSLAWVERFHTVLLRESLLAIRSHCEKSSPKAAEIMAWVDRKDCNEPFSFEACCKLYSETTEDGDVIGPFEPEVLRHQLRVLIRNTFGTDLPHAAILRKAIVDLERGDEDVGEWMLSRGNGPLSFHTCCDALGFDPAEVRASYYPDQSNDDDLGAAIDAAFDRFLFNAA